MWQLYTLLEFITLDQNGPIAQESTAVSVGKLYGSMAVSTAGTLISIYVKFHLILGNRAKPVPDSYSN